MKLPPGFNSAIKYYHYMEDHVEKGSMQGPDNLRMQYRCKDPDLPGMIDIQVTLGELRAACWKEIADIEIKPADLYTVETALHARYMFQGSNNVTELLHKLEKQ